MDLRKEYIKMRNSNNYNLNYFWEYFRDKGGRTDKATFMLLFQQSVDLKEVLSNLDKKFGLGILEDGSGKFIKVVE